MLDIEKSLKDKSLVDLLRSCGRHEEYQLYQKIKTNSDLLNLSLVDLIGFCEILDIDINEVLKIENIDIFPELKTIQRHVARIKKQVKPGRKTSKRGKSNVVLSDTNDYFAYGYNIGKLSAINHTARLLRENGLSDSIAGSVTKVQKTAPRAQVPDQTTPSGKVKNRAGFEKAPMVGISPRADVNAGYLRRRMEAKNIPARMGENSAKADNTASADSENIPTRVDNGENIAMRESADIALREIVSTDGKFDQLSKIPESFLESNNIGVYHNIEEANRIFKRQRDLEKRYKESPEKIAKSTEVNAKYGRTCYPKKYNRECISIIDVIENGDDCEFRCYYSVMNKKGEYLFSEVYSCKYNDGDDKYIKYYKKIFFDVVEPGMDFEFTEADEISKEAFYYGIHRQYRVFELPL